jgi:WD40 repeat protein
VRRFVFLSLCLGLLLSLPPAALASTPLGGLAVALSPDGKNMVAAGDNRVLYVIDPAKMEVAKRLWLGTCIVDLEFNKDGSKVVAEDTDGTLHLLDPQTGNSLKKEPKAEKMSTARQVDLAAGLNPDYNGHTIRFLSMADLSVKGKVAFAKGEKVAALGLDPEGARLAVWLEPMNDDSEAKGGNPPADLKGLAAEEFRLKNDGKTSRLLIFKVPEGSKVSEHKLFYSPSTSGTKILFQGDNVLVVNYSNLNARIDPKGEVTLFQLDNSFNYGIGFSADQKTLMTGGLSNGTYTKVADLAKTSFQPDRLPGWPEYFKGFTVAGDGTAYGATSGYRIIKIKPGGGFDKSFPVY